MGYTYSFWYFQTNIQGYHHAFFLTTQFWKFIIGVSLCFFQTTQLVKIDDKGPPLLSLKWLKFYKALTVLKTSDFLILQPNGVRGYLYFSENSKKNSSKSGGGVFWGKVTDVFIKWQNDSAIHWDDWKFAWMNLKI